MVIPDAESVVMVRAMVPHPNRAGARGRLVGAKTLCVVVCVVVVDGGVSCQPLAAAASGMIRGEALAALSQLSNNDIDGAFPAAVARSVGVNSSDSAECAVECRHDDVALGMPHRLQAKREGAEAARVFGSTFTAPADDQRELVGGRGQWVLSILTSMGPLVSHQLSPLRDRLILLICSPSVQRGGWA